MKVHEILGTENQLNIALEPENPAEVAIIKLLHGCEAKCESSVEQPKDGLMITVTVKKMSTYASRG